MVRINLKDVILASCLIGLAIFMTFDLFGFHGSVAGTIGPGVYPAITLGLIVITGIIIIREALVPIRLRLILPFAAGGLQGLMIGKLAGILSRGFGERLLVKGAVGQGFFSARHLAAKAKPDGTTFAVVTGNQPSPSCFYNAGLNLKEYEPVALLTFDPYVFVIKADEDDKDSEPLSKENFIKKLASKTVGFSFQPEVAQPLRQALTQRTGVQIQHTLPESTQLMLESLNAGKICAGLCPLSDLTGNREFDGNCRLLAVGSPERLADYPDTPTLSELGINIVWGPWMGLALPAGASQEIVQKVWSFLAQEENLKALKSDIRHGGGLESIQGPDEFRQLLQKQSEVGSETGSDKDAEAYVETASLGKVTATIAFFVAFMALAPFVGYLVSSLVFLSALSILLWPGGRKRALPLLLTVSVGASLGIFWVFSQVFSVVFP